MSLTAPTPVEVKTFRSRIGATQAQLADMLGVSKRAIETWEGEERPAPPMLRLAFAALNARLPPWAVTPPNLDDLRTAIAQKSQEMLAVEGEPDADPQRVAVLRREMDDLRVQFQQARKEWG